MNEPVVARVGQPTANAQLPSDDDLRAWDWRAELELQERSLGWLGRHTERSAGAVSRYAHGTLPTPIEWLRAAWRVLHVGWAA